MAPFERSVGHVTPLLAVLVAVATGALAVVDGRNGVTVTGVVVRGMDVDVPVDPGTGTGLPGGDPPTPVPLKPANWICTLVQALVSAAPSVKIS